MEVELVCPRVETLFVGPPCSLPNISLASKQLTCGEGTLPVDCIASSYISRQLSSLRIRAQILQPTVVEHRLSDSTTINLGYLAIDSRNSHEDFLGPPRVSLVAGNTVKLELPSISSVHARGPVDTWYNSHYAPRPAVSSERLPALQQASASSTSSSPRGGSFSASSVDQGSASSHTSYSASVNGQTAGFKTPSPEQTPQSLNRAGQPLHVQSQQSSPYGTQQGYGYSPEGYSSMNQMQSYPDVHQSQMSAATAHAPASAAPGGLSHYSYPPQPSLLPPGSQYGSAPPGYPSYGYPGGVPSQMPASSSMNNPLVPQAIQLPGMFLSYLDADNANNRSYGSCSSAGNSRCLARVPITHV